MATSDWYGYITGGFGLGNIVGFAIAGALSGVIISIVGFVPDVPTTEQQVAVDGLHAFFCFFPVAGTVLAMFIMRNYSLSEERANEVQQQLREKRKIISENKAA